jgi:RimJ/RimL family protein N-acetyltransferase
MREIILNIRLATKNDAKQLIIFYQSLDQETSFMLFEPGERDISLDVIEHQLSWFENSESQVLYLAENDKHEVIGFISGNGGRASRNMHSLYCVIGVLNKYHGQGIGTSLLQNLELWAKSLKFYRMELTVMEHNQKGIRLYEKLGFEREGIKRCSVKIDGNFINEFYMSKLLSA